MNVLDLTKALIACPSVTPHTAGVFDVIEQFLTPLGFTVHRVTFEEAGTAPVENLYARLGTALPNFCFAGHTDVVPAGNEAAWSVPPFAPEIRDGELIGRGAEDMKGAVAAFMVAVAQFLRSGALSVVSRQEPPHDSRLTTHDFTGSISFLITQDEEGVAINGTKKMLHWLQERGEVLSHCLVGEPTNPERLGEMMKIGRRGSVGFVLEVEGHQGHVAYPERADNPITRLVQMLHALKSEPLDAGTPEFPPSNLEVTSVDVGNPVTNLIPAKATARFNVRFNNLYTGAQVIDWVQARCAPFGPHTLKSTISGESFLREDAHVTELLTHAVQAVTGLTPVRSTTGGTSDARFIREVCPVVEFGTTGRTSHMVDERVEVATLEGLVQIYAKLLEGYFEP